MMVRKFLSGIQGVLTTSIAVSLLDVAQGAFVGDWSGIHPVHRLLQLPVFVGISLMFGLLIIGIFWSLNLKSVKNDADYRKIGIVLGFAGFGNLLRPWIGANEYTECIVFLSIFILAFAVAIRLAKAYD
jgi:hypothetical protein